MELNFAIFPAPKPSYTKETFKNFYFDLPIYEL